MTTRWDLGPEDLVYVRKARMGLFASGVRSAEHGAHDWPTAIHQPRVIMLFDDVEARGNRAVALVFEEGIDKS